MVAWVRAVLVGPESTAKGRGPDPASGHCGQSGREMGVLASGPSDDPG